MRWQASGVESVYAFLAAVTLWPVAEATRAGNWGPLMALGQLLAPTGSQGLATQLQHWQDEADAARQMAVHLGTQPTLLAELDAVLEALGVLPQAQQALADTETPWFSATMHTELTRHGSRLPLPSGEAWSAATPASHLITVGERGVAVSGDVHASTIITGALYGNLYTGPPTQDPAMALRTYCSVLVDNSRRLSLRSLDQAASDPTSPQQAFELTQVYVDLHTTTLVPRAPEPGQQRPTARQRQRGLEEVEHEPLGVLQAIISQRQVVLLGDPGSGKSTVLTHLALCLAAYRLEPQGPWLTHLAGWPEAEADTVPVLVTLRDFARWLPSAGSRPEPRTLWDFIVSRLTAQNLAFAAEPLHARLEDGQAAVLLDGLDEVPSAAQRTLVRDAVTAFARRYPLCRLVVTCRTLSYQDPAWQLPQMPSYTLAPFTDAQIARFIAAWYAELARLGSIKPGAVAGSARQLQQAVQRPDLRRLAGNPLLLAVMAVVHTHEGQLPEARVLLYEKTVAILLWRWEQVKSEVGEAPRLRSLLHQAGCTEMDLQRALWQLAFTAHRDGGTTDGEAVADIGETALAQALRALHQDQSRDWAYQVIEVMQLRTGLLLERDQGVYSFPHRTFQEYLAGAYLSVQGDFARQASALAAAGAFWREVILLAVGRLVHVSGELDKPRALLEELCPTRRQRGASVWRREGLAGEVLLEMGRSRVRDSAAGQALDARVRQRLVTLLRTPRLPAVQRAAMGNTLAGLEDPRFREDAWFLPAEPLLGFVEIPAGPFLMGSDPARNAEAYADEQPQHEVVLPTYYLERYPVTVAQWRAFVQASGHTPRDADSLQGLANHPVVLVSWHDALAYCDWLTARLREWPGTPEPLASLLRQAGWGVTLPSEAEWEKAARGTDGRRYPWGDEPDPNRANYGDTQIRRTSPVGCFSGGASPYGLEDMSANVWEWTRSIWGPSYDTMTFAYPYRSDDGREQLPAADDINRVLRGGAFWNVHRVVRCALRYRYDARGVIRIIGFRVALAGPP